MFQCIKTKVLKNILDRNLNNKVGLFNKFISQVPREKARLLIIFEIGKFQFLSYLITPSIYYVHGKDKSEGK